MAICEQNNVQVLQEKDAPLVSVVIPVYNNELYLSDALDSLARQTYKKLEIILVDDASPGNVEPIFEKYKSKCPEYIWKLIKKEKNGRIFHARATGFAAASGDFITSIDGDDAVSCDFYYQLVKKALDCNADVVMTDFVFNYKYDTPPRMTYYPLDPLYLTDFCWENEEILKNFFEYHGTLFSLHAVWNKIYRRTLWEQAQKYVETVKTPLILGEDVLMNIFLLAFAKKMVNTHGVRFYHTIRSESESCNITVSEQKILNAFQNSKDTFDVSLAFLTQIEKADDFFEEKNQQYYESFVAAYFSFLQNDSSISSNKKLSLYEKISRILQNEYRPTVNFNLFESVMAPFDDTQERLLEAIADKNVTCVSFDIFDTLIERPFFNADDTFSFLSLEVNGQDARPFYFDFASERKNAERKARKLSMLENGNTEIALKDIYRILVQDTALTEEETARIMQRETELEVKFCRKRSAGYTLYDYALRRGKKIICVSDMYLPSDILRHILQKSGYTNIEDVFVSCEEHAGKGDGLFSAVLARLHLCPKNILHIGDNYGADILRPSELKMAGKQSERYIPSARDLLANKAAFKHHTGDLFEKLWGDPNDPYSPLGFLGTRCLAGVAANHIFRNPFINFEKHSALNGDPSAFGYLILGTYFFSIAKWVLDKACEGGYDTVHFFARDGYYIKQAYDILASHSNRKCPPSHYFYTSRRATIAWMIEKAGDIYNLSDTINYQSFTPFDLLSQLEPLIDGDALAQARELLKQAHIAPDARFTAIAEWKNFCKLFDERFFSPEKTAAYRAALKKAVCRIFGAHDCIYDTGYSLRFQMLLKALTGISVDTLYLYYNDEKTVYRAEKSGVHFSAMYPASTNVYRLQITEHLLCTEKEPTVFGYELKNDSLVCKFAEPTMDLAQTKLLTIAQQNGVRFVADFAEIFGSDWEWLPYRYTDRPFNAFLKYASPIDHSFCRSTKYIDTLDIDTDTIENKWKNLQKIERRISPRENSEIQKLRAEITALTNSRSYRLGRSLTWFPRKVRGFFRHWKESGLKATLRLLMQKIKRRLHKKKAPR